MKIIKLYYLNDEEKDMTVRVLDSRYDRMSCDPVCEYATLKPAEGREFEIHMPDDAIVWVKKWKDLVLLSYQERSAQPQSFRPDGSPLSEGS